MNRNLHYFIQQYLKHRPMFLSLIRSQEAELFRKNLPYVRQPTLDFGCGDGFFAQLVFGDNFIDCGLDLESEKNKEALKSKAYKNVIPYDGKIIPFKDNHFHTVISNCVFEHIPNIQLSVTEIFRVLKPGGYLIMSAMTNKWEQYLFGAKIFGAWYRSFMRHRQNHFNLFTEEKWAKIFRTAGFRVKKKNGYLSAKTSFYMDLFHYLSAPSLVSYTLFKRWVLFPHLYSAIRLDKFIMNLITNTNPKNAAALFFVLQKTQKGLTLASTTRATAN